MRTLFLLTTLLFIIPNMFGQKEYRLNSPDGKLEVTLYIGDRITYELTEEGHTLVAPSPLSVHLDNGTVWGNGSHLKRVSHRQANEVIPSPFYKRSEVKDVYNEMTLSFREHFNLIFRMYNEGMAYRFAATGNRPFKVTNEEAAFNFNKDYKSIVPYVKDGDKQPIEAQFSNSFENTYTHIELSGLNPQRLMFTPVVIEQENGRKLCIAESDRKCNELCALFAENTEPENGVIVYSELLLQYLKSHYPQLYLISSTTKVLTDFEALKKETDREDFRYVVPDFRLNKAYEKLNTLTESQKDKVEFLCNECCYFGCKDRKECYEAVSHRNLGEEPDFSCTSPGAEEGYRFSKVMKNPGFISVGDIQKIYLPMGFSNYKIEGRGLGSALVLEFLLYYMTKPEYQLQVREEIYLDNMLDLF